MNRIKCLVFDMDGTLTQTNELIYRSFNYIAQKHAGRTYSIPEIHAMFGPPEEEALLAIVRKEQIQSVMKEYLEFYRSHHNECARLFPGIEEVLQYAKKCEKTLAVFTGKGTPTARITLQEFHIEKYFDLLISGNDVIRHKPSSEGLRKIMERFHLQPEEVLMIGDAVPDVQAAHESGVKIAAVLWDSYTKDLVLQMKTDLVFHTVQEFFDWLKHQFEPGNGHRDASNPG